MDLPMRTHSDVRAPNVDDLAGIVQKRNPPFTVIDVNPFKLTSATFNCTIPLKTISDKVGYDADADSPTPAGTSTITFAQWKTVEIPVSGSFVKIEFLPNKLNEAIISTTLNSEAYSKEDNTGANNSASPVFPQWIFPQKNSYGYVLIQFDDPTGPIHLAKNASTFNCQFQKIFITTRMLTPRFSITIGHNATIVEDNNQLLLNASPAYGPGHGLWQSPTRHGNPFCLTLDGNTGASGSQLSTTPGAPNIGFSTGAGVTSQFFMFTGQNTVLPASVNSSFQMGLQ
jgi:hypothetical protein